MKSEKLEYQIEAMKMELSSYHMMIQMQKKREDVLESRVKELETKEKTLELEANRTKLHNESTVKEMDERFEREKNVTFNEYYDFKKLSESELRIMEQIQKQLTEEVK